MSGFVVLVTANEDGIQAVTPYGPFASPREMDEFISRVGADEGEFARNDGHDFAVVAVDGNTAVDPSDWQPAESVEV